MEKLPGDYIAGFVDGESCFALKFRRDVRHERKGAPIYFYWSVEFAICLRSDDLDVLKQIQYTLSCGWISLAKQGEIARYSVSTATDLIQKIIPFFEFYKLHAKKANDFSLWKAAVEIIYRTQRKELNRKQGEKGFCRTPWKENDLKFLLEIHENMKRFKSKSRKDWKWIEKTLQPGPA